MDIQYWVNDKTRMCSMTTGTEYAKEYQKSGYREVTADEQTKFQAETKILKASKKKK
jgi:hypothetical protein